MKCVCGSRHNKRIVKKHNKISDRYNGEFEFIGDFIAALVDEVLTRFREMFSGVYIQKTNLPTLIDGYIDVLDKDGATVLKVPRI